MRIRRRNGCVPGHLLAGRSRSKFRSKLFYPQLLPSPEYARVVWIQCGGALHMLFGFLDLILVGQLLSQTHVGAEVARIATERIAEGADGSLSVTSLGTRDAQVVVRLREIGLQRHGLFEDSDSVAPALL